MFKVDSHLIEKGIDPDLINPASYNMRLKTIRRMTFQWRNFIVYPNVAKQIEYWLKLGKPDVKDPAYRDLFFDKEVNLMSLVEPIIILPQEFVIFGSDEIVSFPNGEAGFVLIRSGDARGGTDHFNTFIDPGFGPAPLSLTVINHAPWPKIIKHGQQVAQIFTLIGDKSLKPYAGSYKNQKGADTPS